MYFCPWFCRSIVLSLGAFSSAWFSSRSLVVLKGLCAYLIDLEGSEVLKKKRVVVGFDARFNSQKFAHLTAAVFASCGVRAYLFGDI
uniref:Alpha-D-phosphohexomutase alpha/beta/alpha domain-containing protein n=1 Tax=Chromera velia CCMP2878 TaxID=1169474 RepID=A0A0G4GH00_9ALVE|eukprot:Cvel_21810.t1-p1 / transcript=Cvel_21810.t1 / gene=Cvel_21810 / organism=Chromera_velia_CCMP2878 / gene_product=Probable phosphoglucomutase-2, putative / transcript_product=Probable phosphoglucomutase-2, putative / location=Cvel_scaffold2079:23459-24766(+) / protein_length=86 / sequence_SO=supercontig / SO=protein_coding / is_pseudo=false